jgi:hypothetical protein
MAAALDARRATPGHQPALCPGPTCLELPAAGAQGVDAGPASSSDDVPLVLASQLDTLGAPAELGLEGEGGGGGLGAAAASAACRRSLAVLDT